MRKRRNGTSGRSNGTGRRMHAALAPLPMRHDDTTPADVRALVDGVWDELEYNLASAIARGLGVADLAAFVIDPTCHPYFVALSGGELLALGALRARVRVVAVAVSPDFGGQMDADPGPGAVWCFVARPTGASVVRLFIGGAA